MEFDYNLKNYLNKNWSNQLKGIAIILVILGHLQILSHAGAWGVAIFLIVSGFGLTQSYLKSGINNFFKKRVSKVLVPYSIVTLIWVVIDAFIGIKHSISSTILALIGINLNEEFDKSMWYITFILMWYIIFYITFKLIRNNRIRIIVLFVFSIMFYKFSSIFPSSVGVGLYVLEFPIGVLLGLTYKRIIDIKINKLKIIQSILTICCFGLFFVLYTQFDSYKAYLLESLFFALGSISAFGMLSLYSVKMKVIEWIGIISFEIYLFEFVFISNYKFIFDLSLNIWVERLIYLVFVVFLSLILQKLIGTINKSSKIRNEQKSITQ
ncbi:acyltransferase [Bacillus cereus]|uniref:acyltransferase family protein n=1 Tax=Bacillus cereus TaxID=1396 RepID=UPI0018F40E69|nr:acyltransferase family protein [Bacillus cereus]MBJ8090236.1 acyltransferase [Bacillus cereus]HDR6821985.1 acyltransferase [Bacillus thuringiensis]